MRFLALIESGFSNSFNFHGRTGGQSYWRFLQFTWALIMAGFAFDVAFLMDAFAIKSPSEMRTIIMRGLAGDIVWPPQLTFMSLWTPLILLITILPLQALMARRLHDVGLSAKCMVLMWGPLLVAPFYFTLVLRLDALAPTQGIIAADTLTDALLAHVTYFLLAFLIGRAILFCLLAQRSDPNANAWGHPPLHGSGASAQSDPYQGYAALSERDALTNSNEGREAFRLARSAEIGDLYRRRVIANTSKV